MIRRHILMSAAAATVMLSGCGGGDKSTPTPTPTASPTPTPTASPTYSAFPLAAAGEFVTINAATNYSGDPAGAAFTLGVAGTESRSDRVRLATSNALATGTYVVREATEESRFVNADVTTTSAVGNPEFIFRTTSTAAGAGVGNFSQLEFLNNVIPTTLTNDTLYGTLTRVSYGNWWRGDSTVGTKRITATVFGYPTMLTDMPTTGTQAYTSKVSGRVVSIIGGNNQVNRIGGTVTVSVNFSTGLVDLSFNLTQTTTGGATTALGTFTAQGAIPAGQNQFTGSFSAGAPFSGTIAGGFFGSQGAEIGITFAGTATDQRLVGQVLGKK